MGARPWATAILECMDINTARNLATLTTDFYARASTSFSATRQAPWKGWTHVRDLFASLVPSTRSREPSVLDLACGNLRFEKYLLQQGDVFCAWAYDNCDDLAQDAPGNVEFSHLDIVGTLLDGNDLCQAIASPPCDLSVCFGFMHHIALPEHRAAVLRALVEHTRPGGIVVVSFWQFARDPRLLSKAQPLEDEGDYLMGWQNQEGLARYCHSFSDAEIDRLVSLVAPQACEQERFWADGKSDSLNCYVVLAVRGRI